MREEGAREAGAGTGAGALAPSTELPEGRLLQALHQEVGEGAALLYLHGSTARGETHGDSDLDLAVLLGWKAFPTRLARSEARVGLLSAFMAAAGRNDVDLVVLNDVTPILARSVMTEGRLLFCRNPDEELAFRTKTLLMAIDLEIFLAKFRSRKLQKAQEP